jgi:hypothetical protein
MRAQESKSGPLERNKMDSWVNGDVVRDETQREEILRPNREKHPVTCCLGRMDRLVNSFSGF